MKFGGIIKRRQQTVDAKLLVAYTGDTRFISTRWKHCHHRWWVLDYINQGAQPQRIGRGRTFKRVSGMAALYAPGINYYERQIAGGCVNESFVMFAAGGAEEEWLRHLAGTKGWCHFGDSHHVLGPSLRRTAGLVFYRRPGFHLLAHGALMEQLGLLITASPLAPNFCDIRVQDAGNIDNAVVAAVERFISSHLTETVRVSDLAREVKMSLSSFAHTYSRLAGESPYNTVRRMKLEAAKHFLLQDGLSVKECAERLGFSSEFHFSRLFKRMEGLSPARYRRALTEKKLLAPHPSIPKRP